MEQELERAAEIVRRGGVIGFPTETVYGLGADASQEQAVARIFRIKGRPASHPLIVHIGATDLMEKFGRDIPAAAWRLAEHFWPGPLTLIVRRGPDVPDVVTGGQDTVGLRVPAHPLALALLKKCGLGLAAPSANPFGGVSPTTAEHVTEGLGQGPDMVLNGGPCAHGLESTIVDLSGDAPRLLRPGPVSAQDLAHVLGVTLETALANGLRVPGSLLSHYAPRTPLRLVTWGSGEVWRDEIAPFAVMALRPPPVGISLPHWMTMPVAAEEYGRALYARLREMDGWGCRLLLVERPPDTRGWEAVHDRLRRAAGTQRKS